MSLDANATSLRSRGGYRMARGWRYTKLSLSIECPSSCCARASYLRHVSVLFYGLPARLCILLTLLIPLFFIFSGICFCVIVFQVFVLLCFFSLFLSFLPCFFILFLFYTLVCWNFVDVPLIFSCPADHVPDWRPRILGLVEARSLNVKNAYTHTTYSSIWITLVHGRILIHDSTLELARVTPFFRVILYCI